jgi:opacity protein-like surface antigen
VLFSNYQIASLARPGELTYASRNDTDLGFETGGGLRYFVGEKWGVRTELRYTVSHRSFGRMLAGVFYQFDREWDFRPRHHSSRSRHYD